MNPAHCSTTTTIWVILGLLAVVNILRSAVVPATAHFGLNVALAGLVVAIGVLGSGLDVRSLGLTRAAIGSGLRLGGIVVALVVAVTVIGALVASGSGTFDVDDAHISAGALLVKIGIIIPLGTVVGEELIFRGVLHGLFTRVLTPPWALIVGAVVFGLWHVFPAWRADGHLVAASTLVATSVAGAVFVWLRVRSDSLVAPVLAHVATNTVPLAALWIVAP